MTTTPDIDTARTPKNSGDPHSEGVCEKCGTPLRAKPLAPQPFLLTLAFGLSFVAMLVVTQIKKLPSKLLWPWTLLQLILGLLVIRGRIRAKKLVFHCTRCDSPLR